MNGKGIGSGNTTAVLDVPAVADEIKTYLTEPCLFDQSGKCAYKGISVFGCGENKEVTIPEKCHHYKCFQNIGLID